MHRLPIFPRDMGLQCALLIDESKFETNLSWLEITTFHQLTKSVKSMRKHILTREEKKFPRQNEHTRSQPTSIRTVRVASLVRPRLLWKNPEADDPWPNNWPRVYTDKRKVSRPFITCSFCIPFFRENTMEGLPYGLGTDRAFKKKCMRCPRDGETNSTPSCWWVGNHHQERKLCLLRSCGVRGRDRDYEMKTRPWRLW